MRLALPIPFGAFNKRSKTGGAGHIIAVFNLAGFNPGLGENLNLETENFLHVCFINLMTGRSQLSLKKLLSILRAALKRKECVIGLD